MLHCGHSPKRLCREIILGWSRPRRKIDSDRFVGEFGRTNILLCKFFKGERTEFGILCL